MDDVLVLWDALFADGPMLDLVDYIYISMLEAIRDKRIVNDSFYVLNCMSVKHASRATINHNALRKLRFFCGRDNFHQTACCVINAQYLQNFF